jgi:hypothetical protein
MRVDASIQEAATQAVSRAAQATGVDFSLLLATAKRESGLDRNAQASTSSAAGLFQFVDATWMDMVKRYGAKHGIQADVNDASQRQSILNLRFDPDIAARMAGELTRENSSVLEAKLGRAPSTGELYAAHVLGADGAARLIRAADAGEGIAASLLPKAAAANRSIFFEKDGAARSAQDVLAKLSLGDGNAAPPSASAKVVPLNHIVSLASPMDWATQMGADLWTLALRAYRQPEED